MRPVVQVANVRKTYKSFVAVEDVSFPADDERTLEQGDLRCGCGGLLIDHGSRWLGGR